ncbi:hypothetical protein WJU16_19090 [Chitinophaga pollutisoli]|uniref:Uncharacterized protein n=1 Tax=Chitinophaga pollutisoli TaxID=3133966 RepID=A0ABZ2YK15_9BACT
MDTVNTKQLLLNLYGLMMEINLHQEDADVLEDLRASPDDQIDRHLLKIKQLSARLRAKAYRLRFEKAIKQIRILKERGIDEIKKLLSPEEQLQLRPLFNKFTELTVEDEAAILEDQEILQLIEILKDRLDDTLDDQP